MAENEYPKEITVNGDTFVVNSKEHEEQARQEAKDNKVEVIDNSIDQQNSTVDKAKVDQPEFKSKIERKDTTYTLEDDYSNNNTIDINDSEVSLDNYDNILKKHKPKDQSTDEFLKNLKPGSKTISIPDPYSKTGTGKVDKELKTYAGFTKSENPKLWYELDFLYKNHQKANKIKSRSIGGKEDMSDAQIVQQNQNVNDITQELTSYEPDSELKFTQTDFENYKGQELTTSLTKNMAEEYSIFETKMDEERKPIIQEAVNRITPELDKEFKEEMTEAQAAFEEELNARIQFWQKRMPTPGVGNEERNKRKAEQIEEAFSKEAKELEKKYFSNINNRYNDRLGELINEDEEYLKFIDEKLKEWESSYDKKVNDYVSEFKPTYDKWEEGELNTIGNNLDSKGFANANAHDKVKILEMELQRQLRAKEGVFASTEDRQEYINEYYSYFYEKLNKTAGKDGIKGTEDDESTQFYLKTMGKEVVEQINSLPKPDISVVAGQSKYDTPTYTINKYTPELEKIREEGEKMGLKDFQLEQYVARKYFEEIRPMREQALRYADQLANNPETIRDLGTSHFVNGFLDLQGHQYLPVFGGIIDANDKERLKEIANKEDKTALEKQFLAIASLKDQSDGLKSKLSTKYNAGIAAAQSGVFIFEFGLTGGGFRAASTATKLAFRKNLTKRLFDGAKVSKDGSKLLFQDAGTKLTKKAIISEKAVDGLAVLNGLAAQTSMTTWRITGGVAERLTDEYTFAFSTDADGVIEGIEGVSASDEAGKELGLKQSDMSFDRALRRSFGVNGVELLTERLGALFPGIGKGIAKGLSKTPLDNVVNSDMLQRIALGRFMRKMGFRTSVEVLDWAKKNAGWHGIIGEIGEELINYPLSNLADGNDNVLEGIFKYDEDGKNLGLDTRGLKTMLHSVAVMGGAFSTIGTGISKVQGDLTSTYYINDHRFSTWKEANKYLKTMKRKGLLNKDLDIEIRNDFAAYDEASAYLEKNGLKADQIKGGAISKGEITATEVEILNSIENQDTRDRLGQIGNELTHLENEKNKTKSGNESKKQKAKNISNIQNKINQLTAEKNSIINPIKDAIIKKKTSKQFKDTVKGVKNIIEKNKKIKKTVSLKAVKNTTRAEKWALRELGLTRVKDGFVDIKGNKVEQIGGNTIESILSEIQTSHGFIIPANLSINNKSKIIVTEDMAITKKGGNVAGHEFLHHYLNQVLGKNPELKIALSSSFQNHLANLDPRMIKDGEFRNRLNNYRKKPLAEQSEEAMTIFLDGLASGSMNYNESVMTRIGDVVRHIGQRFGANIELNDGRDVYNFLKDFNHNIQRGDLSKSLLNAFEKKFKIGDEMKARSQQIKAEMGKVKIKLKEEGLSDTAIKALEESGFLFSKDHGPRINQLGKSGLLEDQNYEGEGGNIMWQADADSILEKIQSEGLLDALIYSQYKADKVPPDFVETVYGELLSHVRNYKPERRNESGLFGWINSFLSKKAGNVYNQIYKSRKDKSLDEYTDEGLQKVQVQDVDYSLEKITDKIKIGDSQQTESVSVEDVIEESEFRKEIGIEDIEKSDIFNKVETALTTADVVSSETFLSSYEQNLSDALYNKLEEILDPINMFKYRKVILKSIPVKTLIQMQKFLPENIFIKNHGRMTNLKQLNDFVYGENKSGKNPGRKKLLPKEILDKDNPISKKKRKEGVTVYERLDVNPRDFENYINPPAINPKTGKRSGTKGNNRIKLISEAAKAIGKDATPQILTPEFINKYATIKDIKNQFESKMLIEQLVNKIDRSSGLMFSLAEEGANKLDRMHNLAIEIGNVGVQNVFNLNAKDKDGNFIAKLKGNYKGKVTQSEAEWIFNELVVKDKVFKNEGFRVEKILNAIKAGAKRNKGFEQWIINRFDKIPGVQLISEIQTEEGGLPDVYAKLYDEVFNVEVKMFKAQLGSLTGDVNIDTGNTGVTTDNFDNFRDKDKILDLLKGATKGWRRIKRRLNELSETEGIIDTHKELLENFKNNKNHIPNWAFEIIKEEGLLNEMSTSAVFSETLIEDIYANKKYPSAYMYWLGRGLLHLGNNPLGLNTNKLEGKFLGKWRQVKNSVQSKRGKEYNLVTMSMRFIPTALEVTSENSIDIISDTDVNSIISKEGRDRLEGRKKINQTIMHSKATSNIDENVGMSTFDFDETLIIKGKNFVIATNPKTKQTEKISSEDWPTRGTELMNEGWDFNFDDFVNVRGGVKGPLFQKLLNRIQKYGTENNFVLTARPQAAAIAIHGWLKSKGVDIPLKNITGLGNSTGAAKAEWMLEKFAEGYNDMYFVDDALPNVQAVKDVMEQLDIKGSSVQARIKFSKTASIEFNDMIERTSGIEAKKVFSKGEAVVRGAGKGRWDLFVPPSAEDFKGLMYKFLGKGKQGDADMKWFKENLFDPFAKGIRMWNTYKQNMSNEYASLKKKNPKIVNSLNKKVPGTNYTVDTAIRTYLWHKNGMDIPGMAEVTKKKLLNHVTNNNDLVNFAETLSVISRDPNGYIQPTENWMVQSIASDLFGTVKDGRKRFLNDWIENKNTIFSKENLNKIEAIHGSGYREALENILYRMENGTNRVIGKDKTVNKFVNWINGSVGAIMFLNIRSAALQTISTVNFINWGDNNIFKASKAFANLPQFSRDFVTIFNSDMLKQRRGGSQIDISHSELADAFSQSRGKVESVIRWMLEKGFEPTRIADSFAISFGGASFYRNRVNTYIKNGMSQKEAESQAFLDFQEIAEETQQSSRPDLISGQQAGVLGRIILPFQNTPMQMTRLMKKAALDLKNGRGDVRSNISKIIYYGAVQNLIFGALQSGLAFALFGGSDEEDDKRKRTQGIRVLDGAIDTLLRGTGVYGAAVAALKNTLKQWKYETEQPWAKRDDMRIALQAISLSPPMGSKLRKLNQAIKTEKYNKGVGEKIGFRIENPNLSIASGLVEGLTNFPMARIQHKINNLEEAITGNHDLWKRVALSTGWSMWSVGVKDEELEQAKAEAKEERAKNRKLEKEKRKAEEKKAEEERKKREGIKTVQCSGIRSNGQRCGLTTETKAKTWKCPHHMEFKDGMDRDGDGLKEYRCTAIKTNGKRCNNKTENKNKKCYAHQ